MPLADFTRLQMGTPIQSSPSRYSRSAHAPKSLPSNGKSIVIKVQVPYGLDGDISRQSFGPLLVYTKKRDFVCHIRRVDNTEGYDRIVQVVKTKGAGGAKAYFVAELKSKDELVVKVSQVLAEQPF
jgi:hypothetical protein